MPATTMVPVPSPPTVAELLAGIGAQDSASWAEIVRRYQGLLHSRARRFRLPESDVLDAVQTTWLRLAEKWHSIEIPDRLGGWLATTVQHECLKILRTRKPLLGGDDGLEHTADRQAGPEETIVDAEAAAAIRSLVQGLGGRHRDLLEALFGAEPESYAELSRRTGMPVGSIGPTRARCLQRLRALIEAQGLAPGA